MTDQTIPAVTDDDRRLAREWASNVRRHADKHFPAERAIARVILDAVPTPTPPTLADMTEDERRECKWMQCDVEGEASTVVIIQVFIRQETARLMWPNGWTEVRRFDMVTPRPDLRPMEWPGEQQPAPAPALPEGWRLADHKAHGRVVVTSPEPDVHGDVWFVRTDPHGDPEGFATGFCKPDALTYIDGPESPAPVPPNTLSVGSEWDDADALARACRESGRDQITVTDRDGDVSVWSAVAGWWETGVPRCDYEPYTVIHTGKGAGQ